MEQTKETEWGKGMKWVGAGVCRGGRVSGEGRVRKGMKWVEGNWTEG